jgi:dTDP-4-amino-4,6-dideoxygalactose transaminase
MADRKTIPLSAPHLGSREEEYVADALASNWVAPVGPHLDRFEEEFGRTIGSEYAVAVSSGTAALHLALILAGVSRGDTVVTSTLTFAASAFAVCYQGARPVFVDSERRSWNMDPARLEEALTLCQDRGEPPAAVVVVHLFGQCADMDPIRNLCSRFEVPLVEDAAEALGSTYQGQSAGTVGSLGVFSFNGNKIITTSGGGMLVTDREQLASRARKLAAQAREPFPHYEHCEIGYNYRLSNVLAGIGRAQLQLLGERVRARRAVFNFYQERLSDLSGVAFMPEAEWGQHTRWLTTLTIDPRIAETTSRNVLRALNVAGIEARPVWKPMHLQPVFSDSEVVGGEIAEEIFSNGLCLPSGSSLCTEQLERVVRTFRDCWPPG